MINYKSITSQLSALENREISSVELLTQHFEQIERYNPAINAIVQVNKEKALESAKAADNARMRSEKLGSLHGIPFTVKDSLETAGIITTSGTLGQKNYLPKRDASIVRFIKEAGGIIIGKTNCPEMTMPFETDNLVYGRTNNPWNLEYTPGGSSGGEGAAISSGMSPLGLAGDAGGSIRIPSHFCGITGIKPTTGRTPRTGHFPTMGGATGGMASVGPMARTIDDLMLVLPILCQPDGIDSAFVPMPYYNPLDVDVSSLRVAFFSDNGVMSADDETAQAVETAAKILEKAGATITEARPDGLGNVPEIFMRLYGADGGQRLKQFLDKLGTTDYSDAFQRLFDRLPNSAIDTGEFMTLLGHVDKIRAKMLGFMQKYDVILCPVVAHPAPPHDTLLDADGSLRISNCMIFNLVGYPSASVPVSLSSSGFPIGVQVSAGAWREDIVLATAKAIENETGGYQKPPNLN